MLKPGRLMCTLLAPLMAFALGCGAASAVPELHAAQGVTVQVTPAQASSPAGGFIEFAAAVTGTVNTAVTWSVSAGGGSIDSTGMYAASSTPGTYQVVATSVAAPLVSGSAQVSVVSGGGGSGSYVLPPDRMTTWKPGVTYNGGIPANRTQCGSTLQPSGGDDFTRIQNAINACSAGQYVLLGPGTFNIGGTNPLIIGKSSITLRGAGAGTTILHRTNGATDGSYFTNANAPVLIVGPNGRWPNGAGASSYNLSIDGAHGATSVTLSGASSGTFTAGQIILLDEMANESYVPSTDGHGTNILQSDDGLLTWAAWSPEVNPGGISEDPRTNAYSRNHRITSEYKEVASWDAGTGTLTFTSPIHARYRVDHAAQVATFAAADAPLRNVGVEAMTIDRGDNGNLYFQNCAYCWAKNVELTKWLGEGIRFNNSFRCELRDSYVHTPVYFEPGGGSYNIAIDSGTSEILIENNISRDADKVIVARGAGAGSVVAYNYMDDGHIGSNPGWQEMGVGGSHFIGPHHILFEGNWGYNADNDKTHGNSWGHTYFRNHLTAKRTSYDSKCTGRAAGITRSTKKMSFVANVLGLPGQTGGLVYESTNQSTDAIWRLGWDDWNPYRYDAAAVADTVRDGNFDYLTNAVHWHGLGGADGAGTPATFPASLYLTSRPTFFGSNVWPWVDPLGATKTYTLPAKARYDAGTPNAVP
jgi:hypothetical protein